MNFSSAPEPSNQNLEPSRAVPRRLRVLISAYACEPGKGSEPGVGWNLSNAIAKHHDVWVITRSNNRKVIEGELAENPVEGVHFIYHDLPKWASWWKKGGRGVQLYYYLWQLTAISKVRKKHTEIGFDLSHHVTFVKYWAPSCLAWLKIPFVWGPVGGGESLPVGFLGECDSRGRIYEVVRSFARLIGECDPFVRWTAKHAAQCYVTTKQTGDRVAAIGGGKIEQLFESGFSTSDLDVLAPVEFGLQDPIRFLSAGRLLDWKGFHLGLRAFAEANIPDSEYWIVGDGPARQRLEAEVRSLEIEGKVKFWGLVSRSDVLDLLAKCHALVHPSLHDSGGWVCLEAMATGRPVICLDWGGPGFQVSEETGFKIFPRAPNQVVDELAKAMQAFKDAPETICQMSEDARKRVRSKFTWAYKVALLNDVYAELTK